MKKQILSAATVLLLSAAVFTAGCKKEDKDEVNPTVTPNGGSITYVEKGKTYQEPGASANDDVDGTLTANPSGTVNTATVGAYVITYTATDAAGNKGTATRTVNVVEFDGVYTNSEVCDQTGAGSGTSTMTASSATANNGISISNFALASVTVNGTFSGTTVTIPAQTFAGDTHSGTGTISGGVGGVALKITMNYTTVNTSGTNTCTTTYTHN